MLWQFFSWYLVIQLISLSALPLTFALLANLPDRGYTFSKSVGVLAVGFLFWLGYSYGLVRNERGGAWLTLILVAVISWLLGRGVVHQFRQQATFPVRWRYVLGVELIFLTIFALWAMARAYDPAVNHTEEPMDLMFMNSIWSSATFPPQDAWLGGYAISYYYFGYWLLTTIGRLAGQPPEIAYTLGQASWYALLWIGCFGMGYNLLAQRHDRGDHRATAGGLLAALLVAAVGNLQSILEWLNANGFNVTRLARWFAVRDFADNAPQTGLWYISYDWWWWRPSRVIGDRWLNGDHMEVIDEFPIFSYVLGDNHPHLLAMPFAILMLALILNLFLHKRRIALPINDETGEIGWLALLSPSRLIEMVRTTIPFGITGMITLVVTGGALVFLNTWDFPPYWLLLMVTIGLLNWRELGQAALSPSARWMQAAVVGISSGVLLLAGLLVLYWPYFLTAQSQAGGIAPNLFNPSRFPQFFLMFGFALLGLGALFGLGQQTLSAVGRSAGVPVQQSLLANPWVQMGIIAGLVYGLPILFLIISALLAITARGQSLLAANLPLPAGATDYLPFIVERWGAQFWTFLIVGAFLIGVIWFSLRFIALFWAKPSDAAPLRVQVGQAETAVTEHATTLFVFLLALVGLLLVFAPEFVYLRDNFGTRMNTVFKFYYQAWLLLGLVASYAIVAAFSNGAGTPGERKGSSLIRLGTKVCALLSLIVGLSGLIFPFAAMYSKTGGFAATPTFDATAYLADQGAAELAAAVWVRTHTAPDALVVEGKGASYYSNYNRISTLSGRPTLLGWDGHESQWRGKAYGEMAEGRAAALETIYRSTSPEEISQLLTTWQIDYVYVGPTERSQYAITPQSERTLATAMDLAFEQDGVRIYQRRR